MVPILLWVIAASAFEIPLRYSQEDTSFLRALEASAPSLDLTNHNNVWLSSNITSVLCISAIQLKNSALHLAQVYPGLGLCSIGAETNA